jgi:ribosomal protein L11 methyltransferase
MTWIEVKAVFDKAPLDWSIYIDIFERHGCENTLQEDTPPALSSAVVDVKGSGEVIRALKEDLLNAGATTVETRSLVDENWEENWKRFFHPRAVGKRFMIRPTWEEAPLSDRLEIVLDPGQAFGTGDHPTTRMCLELLERANVDGKVVADIGCGSGILSVGACLLGAAKVHAVDIEPLSVEVARENAKLNRVAFEASVGRGVAAVAEEGPFDIVVSNIISAILIQIAHEVASSLKPGGTWIVSGIIVQNWTDVREAAERSGFVLMEEIEEDGWVAAALRL